MAKSKRIELCEVVSYFKTLEDLRSSINRRHPLVGVVVTSLMAVLAEADGSTAIHTWAESKGDLLLRALALPNGIPSKDVYRRVLMALNPAAFQTCFVNWLNALSMAASEGGAKSGEVPTLAIDGKTLRGSHDRSNGLGPLHLVSVWLTDAGLTLAQTATEEKSNEITAIPELLKLVDVSGGIATIDAMGTQTAIAEQIIDGGGDFVLALKGNQGGLHEAVIAHVEDHLNDDFARVRVRRHVVHEHKHGRREHRAFIQLPVPADLLGRTRWKGLRTIGVVVYQSDRGDQETLDVRYFISSLRLGVKQFARAVRNHWGIETTCHCSLDVIYREDAQCTRHRHLAENLAWLRRFTLSLTKQLPGKESLVMKRRKCGWNDDFLMQVLKSQPS